MRYFRYKNTNKALSNAMKEQYKTLNDCEKRAFRKTKAWQRISSAVSLIIYITAIIFGFYLLKSIPQPNGWFPILLVSIGKFIVGFIILIVGGLITAGLTKPLWKKVELFRLPAVGKNTLSKACGHLRDYYGLQEPYIITKCFDSTDKKFQNHDVCIFVAGNELRITADLIHGFLHGEKDLGCYAFKEHEITLSKRLRNKRLILQLKTDKATFLLGYKAKGFIESNFTGIEAD